MGDRDDAIFYIIRAFVIQLVLRHRNNHVFCDAIELERMDFLEFIVRVTSHIPDKGQVMIRSFGLYANAHRGKLRKSEQAAGMLIIIEEEGSEDPPPGLGRYDP